MTSNMIKTENHDIVKDKKASVPEENMIPTNPPTMNRPKMQPIKNRHARGKWKLFTIVERKREKNFQVKNGEERSVTKNALSVKNVRNVTYKPIQPMMLEVIERNNVERVIYIQLSMNIVCLL